jgi:uncharacterized protein YjgD (DUF1641 family)
MAMTDTTSEQAVISPDIERLLAAARDSLSDEMVSRLADTASEAMDLIDRVNRTGLARAIPALAELVNTGDLDRLAKLARLYGSAEDALSDEMVSRLAETAAEGLSLLDRLNRGGAGRLVEMLARLEASGSLARIADTLPRLAQNLEMLERMLHAFEVASSKTAAEPRAPGGIAGMWRLVSDPENQDALRFLMNLGKELRQRPPA